MKKPVVVIVGAAAGALLIAGIGASAHSGFTPAKLTGIHSAVLSDEASGARTEPTDTPETSPEPTDTPEPTQAPEPADTDTETADDNNDQGEDGDTGAAVTVQVGSGDHETGDKQSTGGGGHDD